MSHTDGCFATACGTNTYPTMKAIKMNWNPTDRQLRQFGLTALAALPAPSMVLARRARRRSHRGRGRRAVACIAAVYPRGVKPLFLGMTLLALPIGMAVHEVAMAVMFFGVFVPLGLVFRCDRPRPAGEADRSQRADLLAAEEATARRRQLLPAIVNRSLRRSR